MSPFGDPKVGMVTTLYRGLAGTTLGSKLEALGLSTDFAGGVLLARAMEGGIRFGLGATIATTKTCWRRSAASTRWRITWGTITNLAREPRRSAASRAGGHDTRDGSARLLFPRFLAAPDALGAQCERPPARTILRSDCNVRPGVGDHRGAGAADVLGGRGPSLAITAIARFTAALVVGLGVLKDPQLLPDLWLRAAARFRRAGHLGGQLLGDTVVWRGTRFRLTRENWKLSGESSR